MDTQRFDHLARSLAATRTRRGIIAGLAAAIAGAGALTAAPVSAVPRNRTTCRPVAAGCRTSGQCCSGLCETRRTTPRNQRNRCVCPEVVVACGGACCAEGEICDGGGCIVPPLCQGLTCAPTSVLTDSNCMVSTSCAVIQGCDLGYVYDPANAVIVPCIDDDDCNATTYDPACDDVSGSCFCSLGRAGWDGTGTIVEPTVAPFALFATPRCVRTDPRFDSCPA